MKINFYIRWFLAYFSLLSHCLELTYAKGGGGRGGGGGGRGSSGGGRGSSGGGRGSGGSTSGTSSGSTSGSNGSGRGSGGSTSGTSSGGTNGSNGSGRGSSGSTGISGSSSGGSGGSSVNWKPSYSIPSPSYSRPSPSYTIPSPYNFGSFPTYSRPATIHRPSNPYVAPSFEVKVPEFLNPPNGQLPYHSAYQPSRPLRPIPPDHTGPLDHSPDSLGYYGGKEFQSNYEAYKNYKSILDLIPGDSNYHPSSRQNMHFERQNSENNPKTWGQLGTYNPYSLESYDRNNWQSSYETPKNYKGTHDFLLDHKKYRDTPLRGNEHTEPHKQENSREQLMTQNKNIVSENSPNHVRIGNNNPYPVINKPPPQYMGENVWQPENGVPSPAYMKYVGIPTGKNMHTNPHKRRGFIGSLMSVDKSSHMHEKKNKYYGTYPSPYGIGDSYVGNAGENSHGKPSSSASMYTIFPYTTTKNGQKHNKKFGFLPMYKQRKRYHRYQHRHSSGYGGDMNSGYDEYVDIYDDDYDGRCQQPIIKERNEIKCQATLDDVQCEATCEKGYRFSQNVEVIRNKCWHIAGVWRPQKNYPDCKPVCNEECLNGGHCIRPGKCKCPTEFRGDRCEYHFLKCDIRLLIKEERVSWVCNHSRNGTICKINCMEPEEFLSPAAAEYKCTPDGSWKPNALPHCILSKKLANSLPIGREIEMESELAQNSENNVFL